MPASPTITRRRLLSRAAGLSLAAVTGLPLAGCYRNEPTVRVVSNVWPGYELMYVAEEKEFFGQAPIRMHTMPSATSCLQALAAGSADAAGLTLDEVLSARADNMPLVVIAVLDVSHGGDAVLARPDIMALAGLRHKRIGVEQSAVGAVMLDAMLKAAGLTHRDITIVHATVDRHLELYRGGHVDALVTFQPIPRLLNAGEAITLYDSSQVPDRIIDVLAVRPAAIQRSPQALRALVAGHFQALALWQDAPARLAPLMAEHLGTEVVNVMSAFEGIVLPDASANQQWLAGTSPRLYTVAEELQQLMLSASLIAQPASLAGLVDSRLLPS